jgi:hypothetical protein
VLLGRQYWARPIAVRSRPAEEMVKQAASWAAQAEKEKVKGFLFIFYFLF